MHWSQKVDPVGRFQQADAQEKLSQAVFHETVIRAAEGAEIATSILLLVRLSCAV